VSDHANPEKAYIWLDGDGFRAPAGTGIPTDPFGENPVTSGIPWLAYGGIEAGFEVNATRDVNPKKVWNRRKSPYKVIKSPTEERMKMRPVDYSPATVLTALQGGSISVLSPGVFQWNTGDDEDFAVLLQLRDEDDSQTFYSKRVTLTTPPPRTFGGEDLDGFEFELLALEPFIPLTSFNPLQVIFTVAITGSPTGGTWPLSFNGQTAGGIAYNAATSAVKTALEGLSTIGAGNVDVTGTPGNYVVTIALPGILSSTGAALTPSGAVVVTPV
jgi:hypothetical protein